MDKLDLCTIDTFVFFKNPIMIVKVNEKCDSNQYSIVLPCTGFQELLWNLMNEVITIFKSKMEGIAMKCLHSDMFFY